MKRFLWLAIGITATTCAVALILSRQLLDAALLYSWYVMPIKVRESQCGTYRIEEGFEACWAADMRGPDHVPYAIRCWDAVLDRGACGTLPHSRECMGRVAAVCKVLYPEAP